jgi:hypothetical protein
MAACSGLYTPYSIAMVSSFKCIVAFFLVPLVYGTYIGVLSWLCANKFDRLIEATNDLHVIVYVIIFSILFPVVGICALVLFEGVMDARRHCFRMARLLSYRFSIDRAKVLRQECHEVLHGVFAIVATRDIRHEAATVYDDTKFLSRAEGISRVREFAEQEGIHEHSVLLPGDDDTDGSIQKDELRSIMSEFGRTQRTDREQLIESTSLAVVDLQSQKPRGGSIMRRSRAGSMSSGQAMQDGNVSVNGSLGSRTPSRGALRPPSRDCEDSDQIADAQIQLRDSYYDDDVAADMAKDEAAAEMEKEDTIAMEYGVYRPEHAAIPDHVRQREEEEGLLDDDEDDVAVPPQRSTSASRNQSFKKGPGVDPNDV